MDKSSTTFTPYATTRPFIAAYPDWVSESDQERIASYALYDELYWSWEKAFKLVRRGDDEHPIFIPNPKKVVDTTSYYLLKGLEVKVDGVSEGSPLQTFFEAFLKREKFYSRFDVAKASGVARGDFIFHITADPALPAGARVSLTSVDPASYFPVWDEDDLEKKVGVRLVEQWEDPEDPTKTRVKILYYHYELVGSQRRVVREEAIWRMEGWNNPKRAVKIKQTIPLGLLPESITTIPVYSFKNGEWQGDPYGSSELRGFERLVTGVNQVISDTEVAMALEGLGVYATDAGRPVNDKGEEEDWQIAPGVVLEVPGATMFKRVEGIKSVTPALDLVKFLQESLYQASGTSQVALGEIETGVAESGIALAIKFIPTLAKIEHRDRAGLDVVTNLFFDLRAWFKVYEGTSFGDTEIVPTLGDKLPLDRSKRVDELNNMLDRKVISKKYYRTEMGKLGYVFPDNLEEEILAEMEKELEAKTPDQLLPGAGGRLEGQGDTLPPTPNQSNNKNAPNESKGTEIDPRKK